MAQQDYFRFLDLPKELRLMVYEFLPITTTYQKIDLPPISDLTNVNAMLFGESDESGNNGPGIYGDWTPQASLAIVHKRLPGVTVLCTCRGVLGEAQGILMSKLDLLRKAPLRIVINNLVFKTPSLNIVLAHLWRDYEEHLDSIKHSSGATNGHRGGAGPNYRPKIRGPDECWDVEVAVRNQFFKQDTANADWCKASMLHLAEYFNRRLLVEGNEGKLALHVVYRMALLTANEKAASDVVQPLRSRMWLSGAYMSGNAGNDIDVDEWQREWAVGEMA